MMKNSVQMVELVVAELVYAKNTSAVKRLAESHIVEAVVVRNSLRAMKPTTAKLLADRVLKGWLAQVADLEADNARLAAVDEVAYVWLAALNRALGSADRKINGPKAQAPKAPQAPQLSVEDALEALGL